MLNYCGTVLVWKYYLRDMRSAGRTILLLLVLQFAGGCDKGHSTVKPQTPGDFVSATPTASYSFQELRTYASILGLTDLTDLLTHDVQAFKITYRTTYKAGTITASGLVFVPQSLASGAPIVSLHHGTTFVKDDVPSVSGEFSGVEFFASSGYIAIMPDYIGYGESAAIFHPYYDEEYTASAVTDMIQATTEFLTGEGVPFNSHLFLAGYSEGGYVTMATARAIHLGALPGFTVDAIAAGAGGYDLTHMLTAIIEGKEYNYPAYVGFLIMAYNTTYEWNRPLTYFFRDEYANVFETYMTGEYDDGVMNSKLPTGMEQLLQPAFFQGLQDPEGEAEFKQALEMNTIDGWNSSVPIRLYHGTSDEVIPYSNSEVTLENMINAGSGQVSLTPIPGGSHGNSLIPMMLLLIPWFEELK
jgi:pimeloyl-ACP methyl ester carboxylesterase